MNIRACPGAVHRALYSKVEEGLKQGVELMLLLAMWGAVLSLPGGYQVLADAYYLGITNYFKTK